MGERSVTLPFGLFWAGALAVFLLLVALALVICRYRQRLWEARRQLETDGITGLGNKDYFYRRFCKRVTEKNRGQYLLLYFYVNINRLRRVGGVQETDDFLRFFADLLREKALVGDTLARVSDHGFAILRREESSEAAWAWLHPVLETCVSYAQHCGKPFETGISASIYPLRFSDGDLGESVFQAFQTASIAEREGARALLCTEQMRERLLEERQLQASIGEAFARREFQLYLQFFVDAKSLRVVGGEALSRWKHPTKGVLQPGQFVPLTEREKMIRRLDYYCLRETCDFLQRLADEGLGPFFGSCNFSRETFAEPDFAERVRQLVEPYDFPREWLVLEITESASVRNVTQIGQNALALHEYGFRIALDDFGEGFTSFSDLHQFHIDVVKLDKRLIDNMNLPSSCLTARSCVGCGRAGSPSRRLPWPRTG